MNWRDKEPTKDQIDCILAMHEFSAYSFPVFEGKTRGEAADYIIENWLNWLSGTGVEAPSDVDDMPTMENDLIRRSEALAVFSTSKENWKDYEAAACIAAIPAVDAVEVRHARWEGDYPQAKFRLKRCSACETLAPEGWYCFFCGARMDGKEEHNAKAD